MTKHHFEVIYHGAPLQNPILKTMKELYVCFIQLVKKASKMQIHQAGNRL